MKTQDKSVDIMETITQDMIDYFLELIKKYPDYLKKHERMAKIDGISSNIYLTKIYIDTIKKGNDLFFNRIYNDNYNEGALLAQCMNGMILVPEVLKIQNFLMEHIIICKECNPDYEMMTNSNFDKLINLISTMSDFEQEILLLTSRVFWKAGGWEYFYGKGNCYPAAIEFSIIMTKI